MLSLVIHFFLVSSFKIEEVNKTLFEELDIQGSLSLLENIQTKESHAYQYLLKKIFTNDTKTAACHLYASKGSEYFNLAIAYNAHFTTDFELEHSEIAKYYRNIATKVYKAYLNDKSKFKTKMLFKDLQTHLSALQLVEQLVNLIIAGDAKAEEEFLSYLHSGRIQPADYKDILELLAKNGNGSAMGILGRMYFEGWGVEKCEDTAMHYFTEGVRIKDAVCFNGMGDVFREKKDYAQAKKYYEEGSRRGNIEADYNLYRMCRDVYNAENKGFIYLSIAANKGYLPALFDSGLRLERLQNYRNAIMYYSPMCEYSEFVTSLQQKAESYFVEGRYDQAIIPLLFCAELGSTNSMYNILYVTSHVKELKVCDKNMLTYRMTKRLTDMGYKTHVVRLGDCYFYGIGVDRSYTDAFSFYLNASLENDPEGIYSLAYLYEHGLGVEKDLHKSLKYITMINVVNGDLYLLVWYVSMKLVLKIVVGYVFRRSTILVGIIVGMCGFAWLKSYSKKIKKD